MDDLGVEVELLLATFDCINAPLFAKFAHQSAGLKAPRWQCVSDPSADIDFKQVVFLEAPKWWTTVQNSIFKREQRALAKLGIRTGID